MRFGADDVDGPPLEVELLGLDDDTGSDISFSRPKRPGGAPGGRGKFVALGAAAVVLIGGAVVLGQNDGKNTASPAPTVPSTTVAPSTTVSSSVVSAVGPTTTVYAPLPQFATDPGWRIYVMSNSNGSPYAVDLTTGAVDVQVDAPNGSVAGVVSGPDGPVFLTYNDYGGPSIPVGDGTMWAFGNDGSVVRTALADGTELERIPVPASSPYFGANMGTTADGRPTLLFPDLRTYRVEADGTISRFSDEATISGVTNGQYIGTSCSDLGACVSTMYTAAGEMTVDVGQTFGSLSVSPDGAFAATLDYGRSGPTLKIWQMGVGMVYEPPNGFVNYPGGSMQGWSPDGRYFFWTDGSRLQMFDTADNSVVDVPVDLPGDSSVIGVA